MAAKFDQEMMKKHHFWLLLIPLSIGLLLAWIGLFVSVADATQEKYDENVKNQKEIEAAKAQPKKVLELYEKQKGELFELRTQRWKEMWEAQKAVFAWPDTVELDTLFARYKDAKFGTEITDQDALRNFQNEFDKAYEKVAADAAPLQFAGGWGAVLRHVASFPKTPTSEDVWLALEDFWVQRELVRGLAQVNKDAAAFTPTAKLAATDPRKPATGVFDEPKHRTFTSRTWQVDLQIVDRPTGRALTGKIKNLTPRLQPFNANNQLLLKVWLTKDETARPFVFIIEGTSLEGGKEEEIKNLERRHIIYEGRVEELYKVEQVFDARTAPVKRLDRMALGYPSARHAEAELQMSAFSQKAFDKATEDAAAATGGATGGGGLGGMPTPGLGGSAGGPPPSAGVGTAGIGVGTGRGEGALGAPAAGEATENGLARRRYIHKTDQVRAMPVGLGIVADQAYVADVLTAVANTRLRFQTVQTHMNRFRGSLSYAPSGEGSGGFAPSPGIGSPDGEGGGPVIPSRGGGGPGGPPGGSRGGPPPIPGGPSGPPIGPSGPPSGPSGPLGPPGFPGFPGGGLGGFFGSAPRSSSEDQMGGHLVELGVYGILSLYEKFQIEEPKADTPGGVPPAPGTPPTTGTPPTGMPPTGDMPPTGTPPTMPPGKDTPPVTPGKEAAPTPPKEAAPVTPGKDGAATPGKDAPPTDTPPKG